jgi:hypothetical protein
VCVCVCAGFLFCLSTHTMMDTHTHTHTRMCNEMYIDLFIKTESLHGEERNCRFSLKALIFLLCLYTVRTFNEWCAVIYSDSGPGSPDSNYLRVAQSLAGRRLSDNTNSGNRGRPAPSSSIHLSPATCLSVGSLPTRRHSSIGSTDRRPSTANLLPPSV